MRKRVGLLAVGSGRTAARVGQSAARGSSAVTAVAVALAVARLLLRGEEDVVVVVVVMSVMVSFVSWTSSTSSTARTGRWSERAKSDGEGHEASTS